MKILAIGAHPDDIEIGCGGFLIKSSRLGDEIYIYHLTRGEVGGDVGGKEREKEARQSAKMIGAKNIWFGEYEDTKLIVDFSLINDIENVINRVEPNLILTHAKNDEHHDHRAVGLCTIEAARYFPKVLVYENPLTKDFNPQVFVDISDVINEKVELVSLFHTQKNKKYLTKDAIYGLAQYRALQSRLKNTNFVEAFQVIKYVL